jgi:hypothetical protein
MSWNDNFQKLVESIRNLSSPNTRQETRKAVYQELAELGKNFISTAKTYGKIIISEVGLEPHKRTIQPLKGKGCMLHIFKSDILTSLLITYHSFLSI